jgi:hypothetical protein
MVADRAGMRGASVTGHVLAGRTAESDDRSGHAKLQEVRHAPKILGLTRARIVRPDSGGARQNPWVSVAACISPISNAARGNPSSAATARRAGRLRSHFGFTI